MIAKTHRDFPSDLAVLFTMLDATITISDGTTTSSEKVDAFLSGGELDYRKIITQLEFALPDAEDRLDNFKTV